MSLIRPQYTENLTDRFVRYGDLKPCTTAFIDARTPGSDRKENFTIIGPGVAENPDQHIHISLPHGFNIGGARQPPHCVNSQHSHTTAEVFVVHTGTWEFRLGEHGEDAEIILTPGDTISVPTGVFRGFENVGATTGFLFAVLGGDDPGHVTWAPDVFDLAREHGLVLLENGRLVDMRAGERVPVNIKPQMPTTREQADRMRRMTTAEIADCVARDCELSSVMVGGLNGPGVTEAAIIGPTSLAESLEAGKMKRLHGFHLRRLSFRPQAQTKLHSRTEEEVFFLQTGTLEISSPSEKIVMNPGDIFTIPIGLPRMFTNSSESETIAYVVRGSDAPAMAQEFPK
ncbi:MAG: cupin [Rhodospirillaceae bacterium]|nr:MAG: cupin [Rhodospirillaceae bacterium]